MARKTRKTREEMPSEQFTVRGRLSFPHMTEPWKPEDASASEEPKFRTDLTFGAGPDSTHQAEAAMDHVRAVVGRVAKAAGFDPAACDRVIEGDSGDPWEAKIRVSSKYRPEIYDPTGRRVTKDIDPTEIYGGRRAALRLTAKAYEFGGSDGVTLYLDGAQLGPEDDFRFGGRSADDEDGWANQWDEEAPF